MPRFTLGPTEELVIELLETEAFNRQAPEIFDALVKSTAVVNRRHVEAGEIPAVLILFSLAIPTLASEADKAAIECARFASVLI